jgi:hypothetical protein
VALFDKFKKNICNALVFFMIVFYRQLFGLNSQEATAYKIFIIDFDKMLDEKKKVY